MSTFVAEPRASPGIVRAMYSDGPLPLSVHGLLEYAAGVLFVAAPFLFSFDSDAATYIAIAVGVFLLVIAASSDMPTGLVKQIPIAAHFALDWVLAILLLALPFVAGFSDETAPTVFFIAMGVVHLLVTIATRFGRRGGRERMKHKHDQAAQKHREGARS